MAAKNIASALSIARTSAPGALAIIVITGWASLSVAAPPNPLQRPPSTASRYLEPPSGGAGPTPPVGARQELPPVPGLGNTGMPVPAMEVDSGKAYRAEMARVVQSISVSAILGATATVRIASAAESPGLGAPVLGLQGVGHQQLGVGGGMAGKPQTADRTMIIRHNTAFTVGQFEFTPTIEDGIVSIYDTPASEAKTRPRLVLSVRVNSTETEQRTLNVSALEKGDPAVAARVAAARSSTTGSAAPTTAVTPYSGLPMSGIK